MAIMLNSRGRVFIKDKKCSTYDYTDEYGIEVAGITESYGDISYIWGPSAINNNDYDVIAQIEGSITQPTTTITAYLPENGKSKLLSMAKRKCLFDMQIHYGDCNNPTDFSDFDYGLVFSNVRVSNYSTTNLTSRSPDTRAAIDLTFNVSISNIYHLYAKSFSDMSTIPEVTAGSIAGIFAYNGNNCSESGCIDDCDLLAVQKKNGSIYNFVRRVDNVWYSNSIIAGVTTSSNNESFIYTNGVNIYAFLNYDNPSSYEIYVYSYSDITNLYAWTLLASGTSHALKNYHISGNFLYFVTSLGVLYKLNTSSSNITLLATLPTPSYSVFGYGNTIYILNFDGTTYKYVDSTLTTLATLGGTAGTYLNILPLSIKNELEFSVIAGSGEIFCTINGGASYKLSGNLGSFTSVSATAYDGYNPEYVVLSNMQGLIYESFDSGLTWKLNTTFAISDFVPHSITFCGDNVYAGGGNVSGTTGNIIQSI